MPPQFPSVAGARLRRGWRTAKAFTSLSINDWASLGAAAPDHLKGMPDFPVPGDPAQGAALWQGHFALPGGAVAVPEGGTPWDVASPSPEWLESLNGFAWLRHLAAVNEPARADHVRWLISAWLAVNGRWNGAAWQTHVTARRLICWCGHGRLILDGAAPEWRSVFLASLARQARYLRKAVRETEAGVPALTAATGYAVSQLALGEPQARVAEAFALLETVLDAQQSADGLHLNRNPETALAILLDLIMIRGLLRQMRRPVPEFLQAACGRLKTALGHLRLGDGGLAQFHGGTEGEAGDVLRALSIPEVRRGSGPPALKDGYARLSLGEGCAIMDCAPPADGAFGTHAHASTLAFEFSAGRHRLVVNCGATLCQGAAWALALRQTAAHSTLTIDEASSSTFLPEGQVQRTLGSRMLTRPGQVTADLQATEGGQWVGASHDGFVPLTGFAHRRELYLTEGGLDLRGEDVLEPAAEPAAIGLPFVIRFHLHPEVRASLSQDHGHVILLAPDGHGWQFKVRGAELGLDNSTYVPGGAARRRCQQITLSGTTTGQGVRVKWALKRDAVSG